MTRYAAKSVRKTFTNQMIMRSTYLFFLRKGICAAKSTAYAAKHIANQIT